ncbi:putative bifunctional diguanylate cyclase/phosphodiesterase [Roseateles sp. BYS87W]|uniref:EAL domain-containing protein n=1 Tax=Pelomonas baiyunensis TaxID=3299026 RepID=A0ABW7GVF9_9BURK
MDLHSGASDTAPPSQGSDLSLQAPPTTQLPPGPRRIRRSAWRQLHRVVRAGIAGSAGALVVALSLLAPRLPAALQLPQPAGSYAAQDLLVPGLVAALGLMTLWRLSTWMLPLVMGTLLLGCGLPLLLAASDTPARILTSPLLAILCLPVVALALHRTWLRRLGLTGRLANWREVGVFAALAGVLAPALVTLVLTATGTLAGTGWAAAFSASLPMAGAFCLALLAAGTAMQASIQRPRRGSRRLGRALALAALGAQAVLSWRSGSSNWLLLPHLLLAMHALQASPRSNANLSCVLLALWALGAQPSTPAFLAGAALAGLPLLIAGLSQQHFRDRDGWRSALDAQGLALAEWRLPEGRRHASARWVALTTPLDGSAGGSGPLDWLRLAHPRDRDGIRRALRDLLADPERNHLSVSLRLAADGGDWRWHELQAHVPVRDRDGKAGGLIASLADVSWRHTAQERERMSATLFQQASEGLAVVDTQWRIVEVNPAYCDIVHASRESLIGRVAAPLSLSNLQRSGLEPIALLSELNAGRSWAGQLQTELSDGGKHVFAAKLSPVAEPDGVTPRWRVLSLTDLGESLRQQELLRRRMRYDLATGLPNRDEFMRLLQQAMAAATRDGFQLVVAVIDLDDFAKVNTEHGPVVADAALLQLSTRLKSALRGARGASPDTADQLARLHGDEFAVVMRAQTPEEAQRGVERLLAVLGTPVAVRGSRAGASLALEIGASVGATVYPRDDADPETLLRHAGHALYRAKHAGRSRVQFHDPNLDQRDEASLIALARLQKALDAGELVLHYQPHVDLRTGQVMGVEALLRWQHPDRGLLAPAHFLPLIETTGLAVQLGDWVIEQALQQAALWRQEGIRGGTGLPVSVNVGARQLNQPDFPQRLQELLQRQPAEVASLLHLDVLEADALAETEATQALIQRCLTLGMTIALDDFGAGYTHLASLKRLPVDTLKLDRSYVQGMLGDAQDLSLVESVIALGRNLGCAVLAKGVESRAHARELLRIGCRYGQGNGIAAAMPPAALADWMRSFAASDWTQQVKGGTQLPL